LVMPSSGTKGPGGPLYCPPCRSPPGPGSVSDRSSCSRPEARQCRSSAFGGAAPSGALGLTSGAASSCGLTSPRPSSARSGRPGARGRRPSWAARALVRGLRQLGALLDGVGFFGPPWVYALRVPSARRPALLRQPSRPGPREWLRWVRGWARGSGHAWARAGRSVRCPECGAEAAVAPRSLAPSAVFEDGPSALRRRLLLALRGTCAEGRVRLVHES